jgi:hypothetical protein
MFSVSKIVLYMNIDYLSRYMMSYQKYVWYLTCSLSSHFTSMVVSQKSSCSKHYIIGLGYYIRLVYQFNKISNQWDHIWNIKSSLTSPLLLKCLYQARKVTGHVVLVLDVLLVLPLSTIFILDLRTVQTELCFACFSFYWSNRFNFFSILSKHR